ncbi:MAG: 4Fe-4S dicluster domain-containing protein, partial [Polyangiaceae bacterium]
EMHWLRVDRYYSGAPEDPQVAFQPVPCMHCENAPCEVVCPVHATVHDSEGLNVMVYNRCVGTRFCSNNCPYKVRRFNFFEYARGLPETRQLAMNPDVTVRQRGVMEKCSYCVQRIRETEIRARREERPIADGEITTACEQTCPTGAIVFGDIADPTTRVSAARKSDRLYAVLHDLGTEPRTRYLTRIVDPNPELAGT